MLIRLIAFLAASWAWSASAQTVPPLWERTQEVLCTGRARYACTAQGTMGCSTNPSTALWLIQFTRGTVTYQNANMTETILNLSQPDQSIYGAQTNVLLSSGRLLKLVERKSALGDLAIDGVLLGISRSDNSGSYNADITRFECTLPRR